MFVAIVVTYFPECNHLSNMLNQLREADVVTIVYDNTPKQKLESNNSLNSLLLTNEFTLLGDGVNCGLATAYNNSITFARETFKDINAFMFFDQDSKLSSNIIINLISEYHDLISKGYDIGVIGAKPVDENRIPYAIRKAKQGIEIPYFQSVEFVISSFSIVPEKTFNLVGLFDELLFIDLVDSEFSFRCTQNGLLNLVSNRIEFEHDIGISRMSFLGVRKFSVSSPIRNYYQARNLILVGRKYKWYLFIASKLSKRFIQVLLSSLYDKSLLTRVRYFFKGVVDGLKNKGGPFVDGK